MANRPTVIDPFAEPPAVVVLPSKVEARPVSGLGPVSSGRMLPIEPYRGGASARPIPTDARNPNHPLSPEQQAIVDAFWDEHNRWLAADEMGRQYVTPTRTGGDMMGRAEVRGLGEIDAMDREDVIRRAAQPNGGPGLGGYI